MSTALFTGSQLAAKFCLTHRILIDTIVIQFLKSGSGQGFQWCRGRESNSYARFQAQDFKSYLAIFTFPSKSYLYHYIQLLKSIIRPCNYAHKNAVYGGLGSQLAVRFRGLSRGFYLWICRRDERLIQSIPRGAVRVQGGTE
jgi:hypothetical protein